MNVYWLHLLVYEDCSVLKYLSTYWLQLNTKLNPNYLNMLKRFQSVNEIEIPPIR